MGGLPIGQRALLFAPEGKEPDVVLPVTIQSREY